MKKSGLIFCLLALIIASVYARDIEIGNGTTMDNILPLNGYYNYGWSSYILTSQQIGQAIDINKIQFQVGNTLDSYPTVNQQIYMKLTNSFEVLATYPDPTNSGFILVFDGNITWDGAGWQGVTLDTEFSYDGSSNLQIVWENNDGTWGSYPPKFLKTDTTENTSVHQHSDDAFPLVDGSYETYFPNTRLGFIAENEPSNLQAYVIDGNIDLSWSAPEENVDSDTIFMGYNIYRDDVKINNNICLVTYFRDTNVLHRKTYSYYVTAVFDFGELPTINIEVQALERYLIGQGTSGDPYQINDLDDLLLLSQHSTYWLTLVYIKQTADIDASETQNWNDGAGFSPIGNSISKFRASYNGNNYIISNLYIDRPEAQYIGLFGYTQGSYLSNLRLVDLEIEGSNYVGGLVGNCANNFTSISNSYVTGSVKGNSMVGGLVGYSSSSVLNSYSTATVKGTGSSVGGLVGAFSASYYSTSISDSYATGSVEGNSKVGGLVGNSSFSIINSHATGSINGYSEVGGLVGKSSYSISNSYATGAVTGLGANLGGLVGTSSSSSISNCYATGNVIATSFYACSIGGLVGYFVGNFPYYSSIIDSYSKGVVWGDSEVGGLVGTTSTYCNVQNSFWNINTSNQTTSEGGTGLTTAQMQTLSTYINAGWDFADETENGNDDIWTFVANDYPHLTLEGCTTSLTLPPVNLQVSYDDDSIILTWSAPERQTLNGRALMGYNVYRDNTQINEELIIDILFSDFDIELAQYYSYYVTAVYNEGESIASNIAIAGTFILEGQGTEYNPYLINDLIDLMILSQNNTYWGSEIYIEQTADIDATETDNWDEGAGFSPIGTESNTFSGNYDGKGFVINNLFINRSDSDQIGLFGRVVDASLENIHLEDVNITARSIAGALVGWGENLNVTNCSTLGSLTVSTQTVNNNSYAGGLIGRNSSFGAPSTISNCYTDVDIISTDSLACRIGGITGFMLSGWSDQTGYPMLIDNCYSFGSIIGDQQIGGIVGLVQVHANGDVITIDNCYSNSQLPDYTSNGGIIGSIIGEAVVSNSFWNTETTAVTNGVGSGDATGTIGKTNLEMKTFSTYISAGWDFADETANGTQDYWTFVANDYPHLSWEGYTTELTSPPINLQANYEDDSVNLTWSAPEQQKRDNRAIISYNVYRDSIQINEGTIIETDFSDNSVVNRQTYNYYVTALYDEGESIASNLVEVQVLDYILTGQGTETYPYLINDLIDLFILSKNNAYWDDDIYIEQTADIDASDTESWDDGAGFSPIGPDFSNQFRGNYKGNGNTISDLYINRPNKNNVGLFGYAAYANIVDIGIVDVEIIGNSYVAGLIGMSLWSPIRNCYVKGSVSGNDIVGGLVGYYVASELNNCFSAATVSGNSYVGGLVGYVSGSSISNSYAKGSVLVTGLNNGGLVGLSNSSTITNCYAVNIVSGNYYVKGLVGYYSSSSSSNNSFWDISTSNQTSSAGGTGLTTAQMQTLSTYINVGWDFTDETANGTEDVWIFVDNDYPHLIWENYDLIARFYADEEYILTNEDVQFYDVSFGNITSWEWDFDNDGFIDSYQVNPLHSYSQVGTYTVTLTVYDESETSDSITKFDYITVVEPDINAGLLVYYPFNNNADDESGNGLNATIEGATTSTDRFGNANSAYDFDGTNDFIDCPDGFADFTEGFTLAFWSSQDGFNRWSRIIDFGNGSQSDNVLFTPAASGSNQVHFDVYQGSSSQSLAILNVIDLGVWTFWLAQIDSEGYAKIYKNNSLVGEEQLQSLSNITRINNYIGKSNWSSDSYFDGKIDDVRIYNRILFAPEIEELYTITGELSAPENVAISTSGNQVTISWDEVMGATSYKIFASETPNGSFDDVTSLGIFGSPIAKNSQNMKLHGIAKSYDSNSRDGNRTQQAWTIITTSERKFYRVKAVN